MLCHCVHTLTRICNWLAAHTLGRDCFTLKQFSFTCEPQSSRCTQTNTPTRTHACTHAHTHTCTHAHTHTHTSMHVRTHAHTQKHTHTHGHTHKKHTHTHLLSRGPLSVVPVQQLMYKVLALRTYSVPPWFVELQRIIQHRPPAWTQTNTP
jgi:hypothetical protein